MVLAVGLGTPVAPRWDDVHVKHAWNTVPADWECLGPPPIGTTIDLHVALQPSNENALIDAVYEVSTPGRPKYGAYLSKEEVAKLIAPHPDTLELVHSWLSYHGVPSSSISMTRGGSWLKLTDVPVSQANQLLGASYEIYRDVGANDSTILRTVGYGLPAILHAHVKTVVPTTCFVSIHTPSVGAAAAPANLMVGPRMPVVSKKNEITPTILRWLYNTFYYVPKATDQNALGIAGMLDDYPGPADLMKFMWGFRQTLDVNYTVERVNGGGYDPWHPSHEANLGMQYTQVIAYPTPLIYYSTGGTVNVSSSTKKPKSNDVFFAWLTYVLDQTKIPQTISSVYSVPESIIPLEYATTLCTLFLELAGRGVSVLFSSGNYGVGTGDCKLKDGSGKVQFSTDFPASCPWVTSVGGTTSLYPEVGANLTTGGFSIHFPRPDYQDVAVPPYLRALFDGTFGGIKYYGMYNATGRGIPDISAQALNYFIYSNNKPYHTNGTSASVQIAAAIISLLNDYMISEGKPPLGFLNPWLYGAGLVGFTDIISGFNPGCGTDGFSAIAGWDPVTGVGTPDFFKLQNILYRDLIKNQNPP